MAPVEKKRGGGDFEGAAQLCHDPRTIPLLLQIRLEKVNEFQLKIIRKIFSKNLETNIKQHSLFL